MRIAILPVSAILGIFNTRLIIDHFGQGAYAQYGLLVGLGSLLPFADLGISAAVLNAVAVSDDPRSDDHVRRVLTTALRVLAGSAVVLVLISLMITLLHGWPALLGDGLVAHTGPTVAALCVVMLALGLLVGSGQRILSGLGMNHVTIALLGLQTPAVLLTLLVIIRFNAHLGTYIAVVPYTSTFLISCLATYVAARRIRPTVGRALRGAPRVRTVRGAKVFNQAWPMLLQMIALPLAMQTDRLVLSHVSTAANLAKYNLAFQIYNPVWQVASSAGVALWPIFARSRARGGVDTVSPFRMMYAFTGVAAAACLVLSLATPFLASKASGDSIHLGIGLMLTFSVFMIAQASKYPLGMYMTDARGLRYQALQILFGLLPLNLLLSLLLAARYGAIGPVFGSAVTVILVQVFGSARWVHRDRLRRRAEAATQAVPGVRD